MSEVRYGLCLPPFGDPAVVVDPAVRAEAAGWDGVFLWDHVVPAQPPIADPWTTLAAIAQATTKLRLSPMVTPSARRESVPPGPTRHPVSCARCGPGGSCGTAGTHYRLDLDATEPEPYPIPVWAGCGVAHPRVLERAAAGDGVFPFPGSCPTRPRCWAGSCAGYVRGRPYDVAVAGNASPAWDEPVTADLTALTQAGMTWWMGSLIHFDPLELSLAVVDAGPPRAG
ncbi:LLM class flavin-dependent oxidoreductase [Amycolatopsis jiangsuensis]|uniref:Luciferase-like domain-containing protein n=1 Tax=Amycolatopsis jiangsuensis TaxID=1181879 RepID=A0A840ILS9_9PSEU|nr:LLM class flavin-dependent oxidoreductase [Amycolatopsis jiangsuensis]MBB4683276.1 hypothetical protein [Amycolatopsis jiangsuensis]